MNKLRYGQSFNQRRSFHGLRPARKKKCHTEKSRNALRDSGAAALTRLYVGVSQNGVQVCGSLTRNQTERCADWANVPSEVTNAGE